MTRNFGGREQDKYTEICSIHMFFEKTPFTTARKNTYKNTKVPRNKFNKKYTRATGRKLSYIPELQRKLEQIRRQKLFLTV